MVFIGFPMAVLWRLTRQFSRRRHRRRRGGRSRRRCPKISPHSDRPTYLSSPVMPFTALYCPLLPCAALCVGFCWFLFLWVFVVFGHFPWFFGRVFCTPGVSSVTVRPKSQSQHGACWTVGPGSFVAAKTYDPGYRSPKFRSLLSSVGRACAS